MMVTFVGFMFHEETSAHEQFPPALCLQHLDSFLYKQVESTFGSRENNLYSRRETLMDLYSLY